MAWIEGRRGKNGKITWFVYWREGGRGTAKRCIKAGSRQRDARRLAVEIQARLNAGLVGGAVIASRVMFDDFADKWLALRLVRRTTLRRDMSLINAHLSPAFTGRMLHTITAEDVRTLLAKTSKRRTASTCRRLVAVLNKMFVDAARMDYVRQNPIAKLDAHDKPRVRKLRQVLDLNEVLNLLRLLPGRWSTFALVAILTGLRWGEIVALEWSDIDFETEKIHVRRATPAGTCDPQEPKSTASWRSVDMLWPVEESLLDMPRESHNVFPGVRGGLLNHGWFRTCIWLPATRMLRSRLRFHDLRHGFASLLLAWDEPILYVSQQLGHSSAAFTLSTYGHLIQQGRSLDKDITLRLAFEAARHEENIQVQA